jgi:hypothetical protein
MHEHASERQRALASRAEVGLLVEDTKQYDPITG